MPCARKKIKTKTSWIYGESKQSGPEQHSYFGQTAMLPPGENLEFSSILTAAVAWRGEQQQATAVTGGDAVTLQMGKTGDAEKLWGVSGWELAGIYVLKCPNIMIISPLWGN